MSSHPQKLTSSTLHKAEKKGRQFRNPVPTSVGDFTLLPRILAKYLTNREQRVPRVPLGPFSTDVSRYLEKPESGLRITWFGHSSMLLEIEEVRLLIDPVWDQRASPLNVLGPKRFFPPTLALSELPPLDLILISHDHYDHLGKQTIQQLARSTNASGARWLTSLGVGSILQQFGVAAAQIHELDWTQSYQVHPSLSITALPARHFSGRSLLNRFQTLWSSFVISGADYRIYFGADSGLWDGFASIGREYGPFDLTMLEIGAYSDLWKSIHMGPDGAAEAFRALGGTGLLMPIHWALFDLALHAWYQPIERLTELADQQGISLWSPTPGLPTGFLAGHEHRSGWWRDALTRQMRP